VAINNLVGIAQWTATAADCLDIKIMGNIAIIKADDLELEDAGSDSGRYKIVFFLSIF
jgi:hypothetical protein